AWSDFLQTSGQWPISLRMPPCWPPVPRAQVLQALRERSACHSRRKPTRQAMRSVYSTAAQPPPHVMRLMPHPRAPRAPLLLYATRGGRPTPSLDARGRAAARAGDGMAVRQGATGDDHVALVQVVAQAAVGGEAVGVDPERHRRLLRLDGVD